MLKADETRQRPMRRGVLAAVVAAGVVLLATLGTAVSAAGDQPGNDAAPAAASTMDGVFTAEQVDEIKATYQRACSSCHGNDLGGSGMAPPLAGLPFMFFWEGKPLAELYTYTHDNMPLDNPRSLSDQAYADLVALILDANGFPAGESELLPDLDALAAIAIAPAPPAEGE